MESRCSSSGTTAERIYIRKIRGLQHLTYWQQLKYLSLNSLERRRERYIVMYVWRILLELHAPYFDLPGSCGINTHWHNKNYIRRGRYCHVPRVSHQAPSTVQTIRYEVFAVRGPMPQQLRNMTNCSSESFKKALDTSLKTISDEPQTPESSGVIVWSIWRQNTLRTWTVALQNIIDKLQNQVYGSPSTHIHNSDPIGPKRLSLVGGTVRGFAMRFRTLLTWWTFYTALFVYGKYYLIKTSKYWRNLGGQPTTLTPPCRAPVR